MKYLSYLLCLSSSLGTGFSHAANSETQESKLSAFALPLTGNRIDQETLNILNQLLTRHLQTIHTYTFT